VSQRNLPPPPPQSSYHSPHSVLNSPLKFFRPVFLATHVWTRSASPPRLVGSLCSFSSRFLLSPEFTPFPSSPPRVWSEWQPLALPLGVFPLRQTLTAIHPPVRCGDRLLSSFPRSTPRVSRFLVDTFLLHFEPRFSRRDPPFTFCAFDFLLPLPPPTLQSEQPSIPPRASVEGVFRETLSAFSMGVA